MKDEEYLQKCERFIQEVTHSLSEYDQCHRYFVLATLRYICQSNLDMDSSLLSIIHTGAIEHADEFASNADHLQNGVCYIILEIERVDYLPSVGSAIEDFPADTDIDKFQYNFNRQCSVKRSESKDFVQGSPQYRHSIIDFWDRHWGDHKEVKWTTFSTTFFADYNETLEYSFGTVSAYTSALFYLQIKW